MNDIHTTQKTRASRFTRLDWLLLLVVFAVAVFFRLWQQGQVPPGFNFDEAFESLEARRLLLEPGYHPIYFTGNWGIPPLEIYLTALAFLIAGEQMLAIRYVSAIAGMVTIVALYFLVRRLFPLPVTARADAAPTQSARAEWGSSLTVRRFLPFVACLILAVLPWHNAFSREGVEVVLVPLWTILAVLFLWRGFQTDRWWPFIVSGLFWGSAFYTYQAAWVFPGVLVLFVVYKLFQERGFLRRYGWKLLALALIAALIVLPLAIFAYQHLWEFTMRTDQVGVLGAGGGSGAPGASLLTNTLKVAGVFVFGGFVSDGNVLYMRPPLPLILAIVFYLALALGLRRIKRSEYALLLIWCVWMWLPSVMSDDAPSIRRMIGSLPAVVILIALGLGWLYDVLNALSLRVGRRAGGAALSVALGGIMIYTTIWGYQYIFVDWGRAKNLYHIFDVGLVDIGKYAASTPVETRLYYTPWVSPGLLHLPVTWQVRDRDLRTFDGAYGLVLPPSGPDSSLYLITVDRGDPWTLPALQEFYPTGRVAYSSSNPYGVLHSLVFAVDPNTAPTLSIQNRSSTHFEGGIDLLGASFSGSTISAGETLTVTLYWQSTVGPTQIGHTVFTHLLGTPKADGSIVWSGHDSPPLGDTYPTTRWNQGEIIVDRHMFTVPTDAPAGVYRIEAGLYTPQKGGARLSVLDAGGEPQGNNVIVGTVAVK